MTEKKRLSDILLNSERENLGRAWDATKPAEDLKPIPAGNYRCSIVSGELFNAKKGTPGFKLTLEVLEGEYIGRRIWIDLWLTDAALSITRRDLAKLGIVQFSQLERPFPDGLVVEAKVTLRKNDDGSDFNAVRFFDLVAVEKSTPEPFAPDVAKDPEPEEQASDQEGFDWFKGEQKQGGTTP